MYLNYIYKEEFNRKIPDEVISHLLINHQQRDSSEWKTKAKTQPQQRYTYKNSLFERWMTGAWHKRRGLFVFAVCSPIFMSLLFSLHGLNLGFDFAIQI